VTRQKRPKRRQRPANQAANARVSNRRSPKPRNHHFVPQFHLAGFTSTGTPDGLLWVFDLGQRRQWQTRPKGAATLRDFYRLTDEPGAAEAALSMLETMFAPGIRHIVQEREPPNLEERISLANYVALLHLRNPQFREMLRRHEEESAQYVLTLLTESRERWERTLSEASGRPITADEASQYPRIQRMVRDQSYRVEISNEYFVRQIGALAEPIIRCLFPRKWSVLVAADDAGDFICSDHPISLVSVGASSRFLGFGTPQTEVTVPLDRKVAVVGRFEEEAGTEIADATKVGETNSRTAGMAEHYLYAPSSQFGFLVDRVIRSSTDLFPDQNLWRRRTGC
jgi:hypothetical protein